MQTCQSLRCSHKCAKIPFELAHETWYMYCDEGSDETVQMRRLVRAAYINAPRFHLNQHMRLGTFVVTKVHARLCKYAGLSEICG